MASSSLFVKCTTRYDSSKYLSIDKQIIENFLNNIIVDGMESGMGTIEERKEFNKRTKMILAKADFNLKRWVTNNRKLQEVF